MTRRTPALPAGALLAIAALLTLTACGPTGDDSQRVEPTARPVYPQLRTFPDIPVLENLAYGTDPAQALDGCFPIEGGVGAEPEDPRPAIIVVHGGSWQRGDKSNLNWRAVCQWFASEGFVAFSVNYRLAPASTFPAQLDDLQAVVAWLRDHEQVRRFNLDPGRIGAFGGSAGGNLAALLGTSGSGDLSTGTRVAAVAELSGPADLSAAIPTIDSYHQDFGEVVLQYLGCVDFEDCAAASAASPITLVDSTDPPFFVGHSVDEFIPLSQADGLVEALRAAGVDVDYVTVEGALHSIAMLDDDMRARVLAFFQRTLAPVS
jgi:acetyl esterase/lipase